MAESERKAREEFGNLDCQLSATFPRRLENLLKDGQLRRKARPLLLRQGRLGRWPASHRRRYQAVLLHSG